jgi:hypothetical protein
MRVRCVGRYGCVMVRYAATASAATYAPLDPAKMSLDAIVGTGSTSELGARGGNLLGPA